MLGIPILANKPTDYEGATVLAVQESPQCRCLARTEQLASAPELEPQVLNVSAAYDFTYSEG